MEHKIPSFPNFTSVEILHQREIKDLLGGTMPYSDFNFVSLICYDTEQEFQISVLNGNLVVRFLDYLTCQPFYSFLGRNDVLDTIEKLIVLSQKEKIAPALRLVPESNLNGNFDEIQERFMVKEDPDSFDYIVSVQRLIALDIGHRQKKRKYKAQFIKRYPAHQITILDITESIIQQHILNLFYAWEAQRGRSRVETQVELTALNRLLLFAKELDLVGVGVFYNARLIGFSINEVAPNGYYLSHFGKYDLSFAGIGPFLESETASYMKKLGCIYMNNKQDLGLPGLRRYKQSWHPIAYLKKYVIGVHNE